jgi:hypothetical protein
MRLIPLLFKHRRYIAPLCLLSGVLTLGVASGGCGSYSNSICNVRCDCIKCGTSERESCYNTLDANLTLTQKVGCEDATDAYYSCRATQGRCAGNDYSESGCDIEYKAYQRCLVNAKCGDIPLLGGVGEIHCF